MNNKNEDRVALGSAGCGWEYSKNIGGFICPQLSKKNGEFYCNKYKQSLTTCKGAPWRLDQCGKDAWLDIGKK